MFPLEKMWFLIIVGQWAKLFPSFCGKKFRKLRQNCVPRVQKEHFVEKKVLEEVFLITCWQWTKNCRLFLKKSFSRVVETAFFASIGKFWGEFFERNVFFHFRIFRGKNFKFFGEKSDKSVETAFFLSMRTFWCKLVFSGKYSLFSLDIGWRTFVCLLSKKRWSYKKTVFYESKWIFWGESYFWRFSFFCFRTVSEKTSASFLAIFRTGSSKLHSLCPKKHSQANDFLSKIKFFLSSLVFAWQFFVYLLRKLMEFSKAHSTFP